MRKRKINKQYLRSIISSDVKDSDMSALGFATSIKEFADEYLAGIMTVGISGRDLGKVRLKIPVVTYLIRLLSMEGADDEVLKVEINLDEKLTLTADFKTMPPLEETVHIINVAKLAGFDVDREGNVLIFSAKVHSSAVMQIYATTNEEFKNMLITTYKM